MEKLKIVFIKKNLKSIKETSKFHVSLTAHLKSPMTQQWLIVCDTLTCRKAVNKEPERNSLINC